MAYKLQWALAVESTDMKRSSKEAEEEDIDPLSQYIHMLLKQFIYCFSYFSI